MASTDTKFAGGAVWASTLNGATVASNLTAAGSTQATALALSTDYSVIGTAALSTGVILPVKAALNDDYVVLNNGANPLSLYPPVGHKFNNGATNAAVSIAVGKAAHAFYTGNLQWVVIVGA